MRYDNGANNCPPHFSVILFLPRHILFLATLLFCSGIFATSTIATDTIAADTSRGAGLIAALDDPEPAVRRLAFEEIAAKRFSLTDLDARAVATVCLATLHKGDPLSKAIAARALATVASESRFAVCDIASLNRAVAQTIPLLSADDNNTTTAAIEALARFGPYSVAALKNIQSSLRPLTIVKYLEALAASPSSIDADPKGLAAFAASFLNDARSEIKLAAITCLGDMKQSASTEEGKVAQVVLSSDEALLATAIAAVGDIGVSAPELRARVIQYLTTLVQSDRASDLRAQAVITLAALGAFEGTVGSDLARLLNDDDMVVQATLDVLQRQSVAFLALHSSELFGLAEKDDQMLTSKSISALVSLGGTVASQSLRLELRIRDLATTRNSLLVRMAAIRGLGKLAVQEKRAVHNLSQFLESEDPGIREATVFAYRDMGSLAAEDASIIANLISSKRPEVRSDAALALSHLRNAAVPYVGTVVSLCVEGNEPDLRRAGLTALGTIGAPAAATSLTALQAILVRGDDPVKQEALETLSRFGRAGGPAGFEVAALLTDAAKDIRRAAEQALLDIAPVNQRTTLKTMEAVKHFEHIDRSVVSNRLQFVAYMSSGNVEGSRIIVRWLGLGHSPEIRRSDAIKQLTVFADAWKNSTDQPKIRVELANVIAQIVGALSWSTAEELNLLKLHESNLRQANSPQRLVISTAIQQGQRRTYIQLLYRRWYLFLLHPIFWLLLIFVYPRSTQVQAIFFFNRYARRILGLGYVEFLLTWIPYLRQKLFEPFKDSLTADADFAGLHEDQYFRGMTVRRKDGSTQKVEEAIPEIRGQIILEGESGLGKSLFLRRLVRDAKRITVYLPAEKCSLGVDKAVSQKLHGVAREAVLLKNLVYSGALDICIDGLNEVTPDTRALITGFAEEFSKGNMIIATQPMQWRAPAAANVFILQPLNSNQIKGFLGTIGSPDDLPAISSDSYKSACERYVSEAFDEGQGKDAVAAVSRILSNPMDLSLVGQLLWMGKKPDVLALMHEYYATMANEYERLYLVPFPLHSFSEHVYTLKDHDIQEIEGSGFGRELLCLSQFKMVVARKEVVSVNSFWQFRHDKIRDYFIMQAFLGNDNPRPEKHLGDARFRGVYFLLAQILPHDAAVNLKEALVQYAANTHDHTVSDTFVQLLRFRVGAEI
jgi:hypothetical protein